MRTWTKVHPEAGDPFWLEVTTDANGNNDAVWVVTLAQCCQARLNQSPFYGNVGIPAEVSAQTGVPPDYYVMQLQQLFAPYFASLIVSRTGSNPPTYKFSAVSHQGAQISPLLNTAQGLSTGFIFGSSAFGLNPF